MASDPPEEREAEPVPPRRSRASRWVGAVLLGLALVLLLPLVHQLPTERPIRLDVADPASLRQLDMAWLDGDEEIRSAVLRFGEQPAPAQIHSEVRVTDGTYRLRLRIQRSDSVTQTERRVTFDPDVSLVVIPIPR